MLIFAKIKLLEKYIKINYALGPAHEKLGV